MNKKLLTSLLVIMLALCLALFAACGDDGNKTPDNPDNTGANNGEENPENKPGSDPDNTQGNEAPGITDLPVDIFTPDSNGGDENPSVSEDQKTCEHKWGAAVTTKEGTCQERGEAVITCEKCKLQQPVTTKYGDHSYADGVCSVCKEAQPSSATPSDIG